MTISKKLCDDFEEIIEFTFYDARQFSVRHNKFDLMWAKKKVSFDDGLIQITNNARVYLVTVDCNANNSSTMVFDKLCMLSIGESLMPKLAKDFEFCTKRFEFSIDFPMVCRKKFQIA